MTRPTTAWLAFAVLGVLDTVLLLELPPAGLLVLVLALAGMASRPPRGPALGGLLAGIGGTWTGLMVRVKVSCEAFNAVPGQGCEAPDIDGWILIGAAILVLGIVVTLGVVLSRRARPDA